MSEELESEGSVKNEHSDDATTVQIFVLRNVKRNASRRLKTGGLSRVACATVLARRFSVNVYQKNASKILAIPLNRFVKPAFEIIFRVVSQQTLRLANIGVAVLNIALAIRSENRFDVDAKRLR